MKNILNFILKSSNNPEKLSLTIRGFIIGIIPILVSIFGFTGIDLGANEITVIANLIGSLVNDGLTIASIVVVMFGGLRKLYKTVIGENKALK